MGTDDWCRAVFVLPNGDAIVGGSFTRAGGFPSNCVARWRNGVWSPLDDAGDGVRGSFGQDVFAVTALPNGDIVVGGNFNVAGSQPVEGVARWDGQTWTALGQGLSDGVVYALAVAPNGDLIAGGDFVRSGSTLMPGVARWDGSQWSPVGANTSTHVYCLAVQADGDIIVGGSFTRFGGVAATDIARWNGTAWTPLGPGLGFGGAFSVRSLATTPGGGLVARGDFAFSGAERVQGVARWNGSAWSPLGDGLLPHPGFSALAVLSDGDIIASGPLPLQYSFPSQSAILRWNGIQWSQFGSGLNGSVRALAIGPNSELLVAGAFTIADGSPSPFFARYALGDLACCPVDINRDGALDPDDLADFIRCTFTVPPCAAADWNHDGVVDPDDLSDYIAMFFTGCD